tara:strand:+ start:4436 stop:4948 length:513 start_codon:yes stop_codon:yes gene_type:complete
MSEQNTDPNPARDPAEQGDPAAKVDDKPLGENGEKALKAEREARTAAEKSAVALQKQLDEIKQANESELEKAQREASEAKQEAEKVPTLVADHLRDHLAEIHNISAEQRELYLTSSDPSTLLKQAMGLVDRSTPGPKPDLTQGGNATNGAPPALNSNALENALKTKLGIS